MLKSVKKAKNKCNTNFPEKNISIVELANYVQKVFVCFGLSFVEIFATKTQTYLLPGRWVRYNYFFWAVKQGKQRVKHSLDKCLNIEAYLSAPISGIKTVHKQLSMAF